VVPTIRQGEATPLHAGWEIFKICLAAVIAFLLNNWWQSRREKRKRPVLKLRGCPIVETFIPHGEDSRPIHSARFLRIAVENTGGSVANNCLIYLTDIKEIKAEGQKQVGYEDTIRLRWAYEPWDKKESGEPHEGLTLQRGVTLYFDLASTKQIIDKNGNSEDSITVQFNRKAPNKFDRALKFKKRYVFTVVAAADDASPVKATWDIEFGNDYADISVGDFKVMQA
jgi:hypothetical protein